MGFHSRRVATLVIFKDNVASMLNIEHTKDDDEVTLKKLGEETSQESRTVKEELKSYQDYLVMTADMQIYKIIFNIIFATPDLRTKIIPRPIFKKNELNNMAGLENTLSELFAKSRTKAWTELVIKPALLIMQFTRATHGPDYALLTATMNKMLPCFSATHKHISIWTLLLSLIDISTKRSWTTVPPWRAYTSPQWRALEWHSIRPVLWNHLDKAWEKVQVVLSEQCKTHKHWQIGPIVNMQLWHWWWTCRWWLRTKPCQN